MKYKVVAESRDKIFVNGEKCSSIRAHETYQSGGYRWIAKTPDGNILKLDFTRHTYNELYDQTWAEIKLWKDVILKDRRFFPKILAYGKHERNGNRLCWLIEEYLNIRPDYRASRKDAQAIRRIKQKYNISDLSYNAGSNYNWGATVRGRLVIWDFGANAYNCGIDSCPGS